MLQEVLGKYSAVFKEGLETFAGPAAMIEVDPEATMRFCKAARLLPYAMQKLSWTGWLRKAPLNQWIMQTGQL